MWPWRRRRSQRRLSLRRGGAARTGTAGADIAIESAWEVDTGDTEVVVAVVDSGVDYHHRDLANRMWVNVAERDGEPDVDDDRNGYIDDVYGYNFAIDYYREGTIDPLDDGGHGTHCAGIIAAEMDNGVDIAGICPPARIMAAKNLNADGNGDVFSSAEAIYYAVDNGADVISCSWGFTSHSMTMEQAVDYAYSQGVLVVVSAGNQDSSQRQYPAAYDAVISVAATVPGFRSVHLMAPYRQNRRKEWTLLWTSADLLRAAIRPHCWYRTTWTKDTNVWSLSSSTW